MADGDKVQFRVRTARATYNWLKDQADSDCTSAPIIAGRLLTRLRDSTQGETVIVPRDKLIGAFGGSPGDRAWIADRCLTAIERREIDLGQFAASSLPGDLARIRELESELAHAADLNRKLEAVLKTSNHD